MNCCINIPDYSEMIREAEKDIEHGVLKASKEVKDGGKVIKMIQKQYRITEVAYSGNGFFDKDGRLLDYRTFKYKIEYKERYQESETFIWCFN